MAEHVCPVWVGYLLASPVRRLLHDPLKILEPYVKKDMKALDFGCAMGFFSLPLARLVGPTGRVLCMDVQEKMLRSLEKRARKADLVDRVETRTCAGNTLGLDDLAGEIDFALLFYVVHEVPDQQMVFSEIGAALKPNARVLMTEPQGHVSAEGFEKSISLAEQQGFQVEERPRMFRSRSVLLSKK